MSKKLMILFLAVATLLSAGAAVGARTWTADDAPARVIVAPRSGDDRPPAPLGEAPALAAAEGPVGFSADFATTDLSAWESQPWLPGDLPAAWRVIKGRVQQDGNHAQAPMDEPAVLLGPDAGADFQLDAALLPEAGEPVGLVWHADGEGYNRVVFYPATAVSPAASVRIEHITTMGRVGVAAEAATTTWAGWTARQWFRASVRVSGQTVTVLVDGTPVLTTQVPTGSGRIGVYSTALGLAAFDNIRVQQPTTTMPSGPAGTIITPGVPALPQNAAPNLDDWSSPLHVSEGLGGSSGPGAISARTNGAVTIGWTWADIGNFFSVKTNHNNSLGGQFVGIQTLANQSTAGVLINYNQAKDAQNRVHAVWAHQYNASSADLWYARWENGVWVDKARIPGTGSGAGALRKNTGIAVAPNGRIHVVWGRDGESLYYTNSMDGVNWSAPQPVPWSAGVFSIAIGVTTTDQPFVAWIDRGIDPDGDVHVATKPPGGGWTVTDVSQNIGRYAHSPWIEGDINGGARVVWDDTPTSDLGPEYNTPTERPNNDIYYREWRPGTGWSRNVYQVSNNGGDSLMPRLTVDGTNVAHLVWNDPSNTSSFRVWYTRGNEATGFIGAYSLVPWTGDFYSKDGDIDAGGPAVHVSYTIVFANPNKDRYYTWSGAPSPASPTPTATNTATPTPRCPGQLLADVCPSDWFHPFVTNLVQAGAISGYACGAPGEPCYPPSNPAWFRPYNDITRAQVVKVVVIAYNIPQVVQPQVFQDVPNTNPFYTWVNTAGLRNIISGYACGGAGEPCYPGDLPYFRPNTNITRGQVSKVVVLAKEWTVISPPNPTFEDVPSTNPFYPFVETAVNAGILSGYTCGGPGEPCGPGSRPYFRPFNNITRSQAAKMIDLARTGTPMTPTPVSTAAATASGTPVSTATPVPPTATRTGTPATATATGTPNAQSR